MKKNDLVSVILPTYNRAKVLPYAINSVLNQTYKNIELIIVDDGSKDNTKKIVKDFQMQDDRIQYIRNKRNLGANVARNIGIIHSNGEFISFIDSDDIWVPWKLERQIEIINAYSDPFSAVYSGFIRVYSNNSETLLSYYPQRFLTFCNSTSTNLDLLLNANFIGLPTVLISKQCIRQNKLLFDEKMPRLQDWEFFLRLSKYCNFKFIPEPLVISYIQPDSITMNHRKFIKALKIIYNKYYSKIKNPNALSTFYFLMGYAMFLSNNIDEGRHYLAISVELNKRNISAFSLWMFLKYYPPTFVYKLREVYFKVSRYIASKRLGIDFSEYLKGI